MRSIHTLIADDSADFLEAAERVLDHVSGVQIVGRASTGIEAIEQAQTLQPDLVLIDWAMPVMNGVEATRHLKKQVRPPCVVVITVHDAQPYHRAAYAAGADGFLNKGDMDDQLPLLIRSLFAEV